jgi:flagellar assembly protein FliH
MLCRIAIDSQTAEPVAWRSVDGEPPFLKHSQSATAFPKPRNGRQPSGLAADQNHETVRQSDARQADSLQQRLTELEGARQVELAYARQEGFEEGLRKGREESAGEVQKALDQLAHTILDLSQLKKKIRHEAERELVQLSLAVARRILRRELVMDPESIQAIVYTALQKLQNREVARIRVYPAGAAAVRTAMDRIGHRNAVEIQADTKLAPGAIFFETAHGELDASVETQLQEIERGFADRLALS